jgi:hypothetical protein
MGFRRIRVHDLRHTFGRRMRAAIQVSHFPPGTSEWNYVIRLRMEQR